MSSCWLGRVLRIEQSARLKPSKPSLSLNTGNHECTAWKNHRHIALVRCALHRWPVLGHRLTRDHYQGIIARQALRFTEERRKLNEAAAQAWIDAERKVLSAERQK